MTVRYQEVSLPEESRGYILECLRDGNTLARNLVPMVETESGSTKTYLPEDADVRFKAEFRWGGFAPGSMPPPDMKRPYMVLVDRAEPLSYLVGQIREYLDGDKDRVCVLENALRSPSDPILKRWQDLPVHVYEKEVYHVVGLDASSQNIKKTIMWAESYMLIGVLTSVPDAPAVVRSKDLNSRMLDFFARRTEGVFVSAYDGEGYLLWQRTEATSGPRR